ncbi:transcriptional regulator, AsnC family [Sphingobium sp. AP50]|jgi:DNA-binding Lrp family transcriptional regulator|uniref:Lrp/AsnC family transcriptional regulator n=1 Tax=unclassified Sphingobium TaxID=2611147 RepID=UPI0008B1EFB3|nr:MULTISPECIES: Lrp/AsnC family transcriptional regulator [unclassified Sphingobium]SEJ53023.1 transcriptional regulator, AsnC family [Sphingobium sp. AP50]SER60741.1 transcriptional regulator, AsnC family [Sphingobium sp. YR768]
MMPHGGLRLDELDERLLSLLRQDSRQPIAQLAKELGVSRGHLYSRIARLEEDGIVAGYTIRLGSVFSASRVRAHMMIKTLPRHRRDIEQALMRIDHVQAVHAISGEYDIIAVLEADDGAELNDIIDDIGQFDGMERTTTLVLLATKLER